MTKPLRTLSGLLLAIGVLACHGINPGATPQQAGKAAAVRLNNLGVAYLSQARAAAALDSFRQAIARDPLLVTARLNEGIALLNVPRMSEARDTLAEVAQREPANTRAWYNLGLARRALAETDAAIEAFGHVAMLDPEDADTHYFLGQLQTESRRYDQAIREFERCLALDALHLSAEFGLARAYQLAGNEDAARQHLGRFDQLTQTKVGKPISLVYGEQGPYSTAEPIGGTEVAPATFRVKFSPLEARALGLELPERATPSLLDRATPALGRGACFIDLDRDGRPDLVMTGGANTAELYRNAGGGRFVNSTRAAGLLSTGRSLGCAVGDYDNDGWDDLAIGLENAIAIYRNATNGTLIDVTASTGIQFRGVPIGLTWVDYDHDGDVDLEVSLFQDEVVQNESTRQVEFRTRPSGGRPPSTLFRNNGDGRFLDATTTAGLDLRLPSVALIGTDLNNDRAIDLVSTEGMGIRILTNPREGKFRSDELRIQGAPAQPAGVVAFDFNKDGWMDLAFTHWAEPGISLWKNVNGARFERVAIPQPQWKRGWGLAAIDVDNDGWLDLAAVGETDDAGAGELRLFRNLGGEKLSDVSMDAGLGVLKLIQPRALVIGDTDGDGDNDFLITQNGQQAIVVRNDGGNQRTAIQLALRGLADNRTGIGTKVEVFAGALRQKWEIPSSSGYLGQNAPGVLAGIDNAREADIVRLLWPTGVIQDEVQLPSGRRHLIGEIDRRGSSCPVLFSWNGREYEFIADMIGPGIVGHWEGPGRRNTPDPTEYLLVEGSRAKPRNGRLSFKFAEVMEEITYLDQVRLLAVDHPSQIAAYPNEYFAATPPFPEFKVVTSQGARPPNMAIDDGGRNALPALRDRDRRYVTGFESIQFPGYAKPHFLEMDLAGADVSGPIRLIMRGFIEYFTATSVFAAHQAGIEAVVPYLDAQTADGKWKRVADDIGFPAGLARTTIADLTGKLPTGTKRVRIGTNLRIFWDQILIDTTPQNATVALHEIPLAEASMGFLGYPRQLEGNPPVDLSYAYNQVSATGPFSFHSGAYTAYGKVLDLVRSLDDSFAILGSGDEVSLEFDVSKLPALREGWTRDYFFFADGFAKDMDFYEALSDTVEPLPFHAMGEYPYEGKTHYPSDSAHLNYRLNINTRVRSESGGVPSFRFRY